MPLDISNEYLESVLALNNAHATELSSLTLDELRAILANAFYGRRLGETEGFLIALDDFAHAIPDLSMSTGSWWRKAHVAKAMPGGFMPI